MGVEEAEEYKSKGNALFTEGKWEDAIKQYNKAITLDPDNAAYYSNRSAAWSQKGNHDSALADANKCIQKDPSFVKGYSRKGKALFDLGQDKEAEEAYKDGLSKESDNAACKRGIDDITNARKKKKSGGGSRSGGGGGGGGGMMGGLLDGGIQGLVQMVVDRLKKGGRMQTYMMVLVGYFLFTSLTGRNKTAPKDSVTETVQEDDEPLHASSATAPTLSRRFKELDGTWLSYMGTESKADSLLLMLHRTSGSAETDFSTAFPSIAKVAAQTSRLLAPDRPCHGFSPCPTGGEPAATDSAWLNRLVRAGGVPEKITVVAVGREAAAQALSLAVKRREVTHILLLHPKVVSPPRGKMTEAGELTAWLSKHGYPTSGQAAADAIRWAAAGDSDGKEKLMTLAVDKLPQDCRVTILYDTADEEDEELRQALETQGTEVKTRSTAGNDDFVDILVDEVQQALTPESSSVDMES